MDRAKYGVQNSLPENIRHHSVTDSYHILCRALLKSKNAGILKNCTAHRPNKYVKLAPKSRATYTGRYAIKRFRKAHVVLNSVMKHFAWNSEKNEQLIQERGISFSVLCIIFKEWAF